jgi:hypothetical protein
LEARVQRPGCHGGSLQQVESRFGPIASLL